MFVFLFCQKLHFTPTNKTLFACKDQKKPITVNNMKHKQEATHKTEALLKVKL